MLEGNLCPSIYFALHYIGKSQNFQSLYLKNLWSEWHKIGQSGTKMLFSITFQKFAPVALNLHNTVSDDLIWN